jgi:uncharacterized paraquat-inducible protein A
MARSTPDRGEEPARGMVARFLTGRDVTCPICDYNLRDNASSVCPECGAALELRLTSSDLRLGPWLLAMLGIALPLGFFVPILVISILVELVPDLSGPPHALIAFGVATGVFVVALSALILKRRRFWRRRRPAQWWFATVIATTGGICLVAIIWLIFFP